MITDKIKQLAKELSDKKVTYFCNCHIKEGTLIWVKFRNTVFCNPEDEELLLKSIKHLRKGEKNCI
jgi:hypothetical protein